MDLAKLGLKSYKKESTDAILDYIKHVPDTGSDSADSPVHAARVHGREAEAGIESAQVASGVVEAKPNALALLMKRQAPQASSATEESTPLSKALPTIMTPGFGEDVPPKKNSFLATLGAKSGLAIESTAAKLPSLLDLPADKVEEIPVGPEGFQWHLDRLDALIQADSSIGPLVYDSIKGKMKDIFVELNQFPEYDGLIIARDTHNMMKFMQQSMSQTEVVIEKKVAARTAKESKPRRKFDLSGLDNLAVAKLGVPASLDDIGTLDTDDIAARTRRGS